MFAFVTSIRARALAADWDHHVRLLDRTLASFLAQTDPDLVVAVVCHDVPEVRVRDRRVHFITVDFPPPEREYGDMTVDKVLKVSIGAQWAIDQGCRFLMYADADDLVSRRLAEFAGQRPDASGWFFTEGYSHRYGRPWLTRSHDHEMTCGTCAIVRSDALRFAPDPGYRGATVNTLAAFGHTGYRSFMADAGYPLEPLPFPGSVYISHSDSVVTTLPESRTAPTLRDRLRMVRRGWQRARDSRPLTPALAREFTILRTRP